MTVCSGVYKVLMFLSETRWYAHADAPNTFRNSYNHIFETLTAIARNTDQSVKSRNGAQSLVEKI